MISIKVKTDTDIELPKYQSEGAAGMDVSSKIDYTLSDGETKIIPTGLFLEIPKGYEAQVRPRSGLAAKHGITVLNSPGTIDSDYRGEVGVILINLSYKSFEIRKGDRIAQLVFAPVQQVELIQVETLEETDRGEGGFGSTGKDVRTI